jgi:predicted secreted protein
LVAYDEASDVIESVGSNVETTFSDIESQTGQLASATDEATGKMTDDYQQVEAAGLDLADVESQTQSLASTTADAAEQMTSTYGQVEEAGGSLADNVSGNLTDIESQTEEFASATDEATVQVVGSYGNVDDALSAVTGAQEEASVSGSQAAMSMSTAGFAAGSLVMSVNNLMNAQVSLDRANLTVQKSQDTLTAAQITAEKQATAVQAAQNAYNAAVEKYGADSTEAKAALEKLDTAQQTYQLDLNKVQVAQDALTVAHERADEAQRNLDVTMLYSALTVIPALTSIIRTVSDADEIWTGIQAGLNAVMDANPIILVTAAIAALVAGIIYAYENCKPFRDIINEIGSVLLNFFKGTIDQVTAAWAQLTSAVSIIYDALKGLWDSVFVPLGDFLLNTFISSILEPLLNAWNDISDAVTWLWKNVLEPLAAFLTGAFETAFNVIMVPINAFLKAINDIIGAAKTVSDFLGGLGKALGSLCFAHATPAAEAFNATLTDSMDMTDALTGKVSGLSDSLKTLSGIGAGVTPFLGVGGAGGILGAGPVLGPAAAAPVNIYVTAPLVNVQGAADVTTAALAAKLVQGALSSVVVKATSPNAPASNQVIVNPGSMPGATPTGMAAQASAVVMTTAAAASTVLF